MYPAGRRPDGRGVQPPAETWKVEETALRMMESQDPTDELAGSLVVAVDPGKASRARACRVRDMPI